MTDDSASFWPPQVRQLRIGDISIDLSLRRISRSDGDAELPQRMFDLLLLLAAEPHTLHTRGELLRRVWPGVIVEDANLSQSISMLRKALGDERKAWIRTRSKQGYVFEPPHAIETLETSASSPRQHAPPASGAPMHPAPIPGATGAASTGRRRSAAIVGIGMVLALLAALLLWSTTRPDNSASPAIASSITLITVEDPGTASTGAAALELLNAWLGWKLASLPEVTLLTPAHLAADPDAQASNTVVLLFAGRSPRDASQILLRAQFDTAEGPQRLQAEGPATDMDRLVDRLSNNVLAAMFPNRPADAWPALKVPPEAADTFMRLARARRDHDWVGATRIGEDLAEAAPDFALGQLLLAQTLSRLGRLPDALQHFGKARELLQPLPEQADAIIRAQQLGLSPQHAEAADAYGALARQYPEQTAFPLAQARALGHAGRFADALAILEGPLWQRPQPAYIEMMRWSNQSWFELALGDVEAGLSSAKRADALAEAAGPEWAYERGQTLLMLAQATNIAEPNTSNDYFEAAAAQFEQAGDGFSALRSRFMGEIAGPPKAEPRYLDAWLAQARAAGQRQLELGALRDVALQYYRAGDLPAYRQRLIQAMAVAEAMDDPWGTSAIELDLLNEEYLQGHFDKVEQRVTRLRDSEQQGEFATWADLYDVFIAQLRGQNRAALDIVERTIGADAPSGEEDPAPARIVQDRYACAGAQIHLTVGNPTAARAHYARCPQGDPALRLVAMIGLAEVDLDSGDRDAALDGLHKAVADIPALESVPGQWILGLEAAPILAAAGDTDTASMLYARILPAVRAAGYGLLESAALAGQAELALAAGDTAAARRLVQAARTAMPSNIWILEQRLLLVEALLARGDPQPDTATQLLQTLALKARQHEDVLMQLRVHSVLGDQDAGARPDTEHLSLTARTGLRGVSAQWLAPGPRIGSADSHKSDRR